MASWFTIGLDFVYTFDFDSLRALFTGGALRSQELPTNPRLRRAALKPLS